MTINFVPAEIQNNLNGLSTITLCDLLFKTINDKQINVFIAIQGRREGGRGENDPGAHGL